MELHTIVRIAAAALCAVVLGVIVQRRRANSR
jgi:hypothetical protein